MRRLLPRAYAIVTGDEPDLLALTPRAPTSLAFLGISESQLTAFGDGLKRISTFRRRKKHEKHHDPGVIFDLDGVLVHTDELHFRAWSCIAEELGIPFDRGANDRLRGVSRAESPERLLAIKPEVRLGDKEKAALCERKNSLVSGKSGNADCGRYSACSACRIGNFTQAEATAGSRLVQPQRPADPATHRAGAGF